MSVARKWSHVVKIESVSDGIEFTFQPQSLLLVRNRAFTSSDVKEKFLASAREFQTLAVPS